MTFRPWLVLTAALPLVVLSACTDRVQQQPGCLTDDDCLRPRMCVEGACFDPDRVDVGMSDADGSGGLDAEDGSGGQDSGIESDATADAGGSAELDGFGPVPDVPPGRACLEARPTRIDLGDVVIGDRIVRSALFENCGRLPVTLERVEFFDPDNLVTALDVPFVPVTLEPGDSEPVIFAIEPVAQGPFAAQVEMSWAEGEPVFVSVEGQSVADPGPEPEPEPEPAPEPGCIGVDRVTSFGQIPFADGSVSGVFVVRNCGETPLTDVLVTTSIAEVTVQQEQPVTIPPFGQVEVSIVFTPEAIGPVVGLIGANNGVNTASGFVHAHAVTEVGIPGCLAASPEATSLGEAPVGSTLPTTVRLTNCGSRPVEVGPPVVIGVTGEGGLLEVPQGPFTILETQSLDLAVALTLGSEGERRYLVGYLPVDGSAPAAFYVSAVGVQEPTPEP